MRRAFVLSMLCVSLVACGGSVKRSGGNQSAVTHDASVDAGHAGDAALPTDGGGPGARDAGRLPDGGRPPAHDSGDDPGTPDAHVPTPDASQHDANMPDATPSPTLADVAVEVGRTFDGHDHVDRGDVPKGGTLFSVWTHIADPGPNYPWQHKNMDVYILYGNDWYFRCLVGNSNANSPTDARYNANSMLFAKRPAKEQGEWVQDSSYYESGYGHPDAPYKDWVWAAWQVIVTSDSFIVRQWLKFGMEGKVFAAGADTLTFAAMRKELIPNAGLNGLSWSQDEADAWQPTDATSFQIGKDPGFITHARMEARSTEPSLDELEAIARSNSPDASAWGDYPFVWNDGSAYLKDVSGHGRDLTLEQGGTLYQGIGGPQF